jgi:hypothetical protein
MSHVLSVKDRQKFRICHLLFDNLAILHWEGDIVLGYLIYPTVLIGCVFDPVLFCICMLLREWFIEVYFNYYQSLYSCYHLRHCYGSFTRPTHVVIIALPFQCSHFHQWLLHPIWPLILCGAVSTPLSMVCVLSNSSFQLCKVNALKTKDSNGLIICDSITNQLLYWSVLFLRLFAAP